MRFDLWVMALHILCKVLQLQHVVCSQARATSSLGWCQTSVGRVALCFIIQNHKESYLCVGVAPPILTSNLKADERWTSSPGSFSADRTVGSIEWVCFRAILGIEEMRDFFYIYQESKQTSTVCQPLLKSLYRISYHFFAVYIHSNEIHSVAALIVYWCSGVSSTCFGP